MSSMHLSQKWSLVGLALLLILSALSCSLIPGARDQEKKEWSIDKAGLKALIDQTNQGKAESDRLLKTIERLEFPRNGGLKVYGACPFENAPAPDGEFGIALNNQDSRVRLEISVGDTCGIQQDDPRVARMNSELSNALWEKITADCGNILVDWIQLSGDQLLIKYVKAN